MRILAIGGHICDMEFSCGAILAKHARMGDEVYILSTTVGEKGYPWDDEEGVKAYKQQKIEEGKRCGEKLGAVESWYLDYEDSNLPLSRAVQEELCDEIRRIRPDIVITHWNKATHNDHLNTALNVEKAVSLAGLPSHFSKYPVHGVKRLFYTDNFEDPIDFYPNVYISFEEEDMQRWQEAIRELAVGRGEILGIPFGDFYQSYARTKGIMANKTYAQAFYTNFKVKTDKLFTAIKPE